MDVLRHSIFNQTDSHTHISSESSKRDTATIWLTQNFSVSIPSVLYLIPFYFSTFVDMICVFSIVHSYMCYFFCNFCAFRILTFQFIVINPFLGADLSILILIQHKIGRCRKLYFLQRPVFVDIILILGSKP